MKLAKVNGAGRILALAFCLMLTRGLLADERPCWLDPATDPDASDFAALQTFLLPIRLEAPAEDAKLRFLHGDKRMLAVGGFGIEYPGVADKTVVCRVGGRYIEGTTDGLEHNEHGELVAMVTTYAHAYNQAMLKLLAGNDQSPKTVPLVTKEKPVCRPDLALLGKVLPAYPLTTPRLQKDFVVLRFTVATDGSPEDINVAESSSKVFHRSAIAAMQQWRFESPDEPCHQELRMEYAVDASAQADSLNSVASELALQARADVSHSVCAA